MPDKIIDPKTAKKIASYKEQAKSLYRSYHNMLGDYSCGIQMAEYLSPGLVQIRNDFNHVMETLKSLDPTCPEFRLWQ